jgi:KDO2-lipid IV(A) lauroyltransferase
MIGLIGWVWWWLVPIRKRLAVANFSAAFPDLPPKTLQRTVGEMVWGYVELARGKRAEVHGAELVQEGGICLAGHLGAWDMGLISAGECVNATVFVRTPANPLVARWIERARLRTGLQLLAPSGSAMAAYRALRSGRLLVFVQDQRHNQGIPVPFFGRPALTSRGCGVLAARTGAPVFGARQWRDASGNHHISFERLPMNVSEDPETAVRELTEASQRFYEDRINLAPHSWLWLHDRWRANSG